MWVRACLQDGNLHIQVRDSGMGISESAIAHVFTKNCSDLSNSSMGLRNVNQRLEHVYGPASRLRIDSATQMGAIITVILQLAKGFSN